MWQPNQKMVMMKESHRRNESPRNGATKGPSCCRIGCPKETMGKVNRQNNQEGNNSRREHEDSLFYHLGSGFGCAMAQNPGTIILRP